MVRRQPSVRPSLAPAVLLVALALTSRAAVAPASAPPEPTPLPASAPAGPTPPLAVDAWGDVELSFLEAFALAEDRSAVLDQLVPGSEAQLHFRCLAAQHARRWDDVPPLLAEWEQRFGRTGRWQAIRHRQALLSHERDPAATFAYLREQLSPDHSHRRRTADADPGLPTHLDPALTTREAWIDRALARRSSSVAGLGDDALDDLLDRGVDDRRLIDVLRRLERPDHPAVPGLVLRGLEHRDGPAFGQLPIHRRLLTDQLEALRRARPEIARERAWVDAVLTRMRPADTVDLEHDRAAREAWLSELLAFTRELPAVHNSLKAHALFHRLRHDLAGSGPDRQDLIDYLRLPRQDATRVRALMSAGGNDALVRGGQDFPTGLTPLGDDRELLTACLTHAFRRGDGVALYTEFLEPAFVRPIHAETLILHGLVEPDAAYGLLDDPAAWEELRQRVELRWSPSQPRRFALGDVPHLDVELKNVPRLLVKVFAIDAFGHLSRTGAEVDVDLDLDGLVPHVERVVSSTAGALRREARRIELPELEGPGTWLVELVGAGLTRRAVVRVGRLQLLARRGAGGHVLSVLDDDDQVLDDAAVWIDGRQYEADEQGRIAVPFSSEPGRRDVILRHGDRADLASFDMLDERYALRAAILLERESLLPRQEATVVVRPTLWVAGRPASVALLEEPVLRIEATDHDGLTTTLDRPLELADDAEAVTRFSVPERLASLRLSVRGRVPMLSRDDTQDLTSAALTVPVNGQAAGSRLAAALLGRTPDGYVVDLLGRNGEPLPGRRVHLVLRHGDVRDELDAPLQTDADGRVHLGALPGVVEVRWIGSDTAGGQHDRWELPHDAATLPDVLTVVEGETLRLPAPGVAAADRRHVSLLGLAHDVPATDRREHLALVGGQLVITGLPAGHHDLRLKASDQTVRIEVLAGERRGPWVVGPLRGEAPALDGLAVSELRAGDDELVIALADAGPDARVHVLATRWLPALDPWLSLEAPTSDASRRRLAQPAESLLSDLSTLSDEARYVLERRHAARFPGNMLPRPGLVLNPMERAESDSDVLGIGGSDGGFGGRGKLGRRGASTAGPVGPEDLGLRSPQLWADLGYLSTPSVLLTNLRPDDRGRVVVPRAELGGARQVSVVAVQGEATVLAGLALGDRPLARRDLRLPDGLVLDDTTSEQRAIVALEPGASVTFEDVATSQARLYGTLDDVFELLTTVGPAAELRPWRFLTRWPSLSRDEKLARYDEFASHELHLFLHEKDRDFFDEVVRPYLAQKLHPTFLDDWLLRRDLTPHTTPWAYARLNVLERILLGRRMGTGEATRRALADALALRPGDPAAARVALELALSAGQLDTASSLGRTLASAGAALREELETLAALGYTGDEQHDAFSTDFNLLPGAASDPEAALVVPSASPALATGRGRSARGQSARMDTLADDMLLRYAAPQLYVGPGRTREYVEHAYWQRPIHEQHGGLLALNRFWVDLASTPADAPFVSTAITEPTDSVNAALLALALLDLPFEAEPVEPELDGHRLTLTATGRALLAREVLAPAPPATDAAALLISQDVYRLSERFVYEGNQRRDAFLDGELLAGVAYGCQIVLTNPSSAPRDLALLAQIPAGALPLDNGQATFGRDVVLAPYGTITLDMAFVFPVPGSYRMAPARVARDGALVAAAAGRTLQVVETLTQVDTTSWEHVSQDGSLEQVLDFLAEANLERTDLGAIAWRMRTRTEYDAVLEQLRGRLHIDPTLWAYGLLHEDARATAEWLPMTGLADACGPWLRSPLLDVDPLARHTYEHVDFAPLINARAHALGGERRVEHPVVEAQYRTLLGILCHRPRLDDADLLAVLYQWTLQDRVADALALLPRVARDRLDARLQYDYLAAYLGFYDDPSVSAALAERHAGHPVPRWRERFAEVAAHLAEAGTLQRDGDAGGGAAAEPIAEATLDLELVDGRLVLHHGGLERCELRWSPMDVELLFSMLPFGSRGSGDAGSLQPHGTLEVLLDGDGTTLVELPEVWRQRHVQVEARAGGLRRHVTRYAHDLSVAVEQGRGQLRVGDPATGRPLPGVYVKVYAHMPDGSEPFHKDGYTDLRGRFDYVAVSSSSATPERFAILVLDAQRGAVVREVDAPAR